MHLFRSIHALWFVLRNELGDNWVKYGPWDHGRSYNPAQRVQDGPRPECFLGYCKSRGRDGYISMVLSVFRSVNTRKIYL